MWWLDTSPWREEKPRKQVQVEAEEELGPEPDLPAELVHFLAEGTPTSTESPQHSLATAGGAWPKILATASSSWSCLGQGQEGRDQTLLGIPAGGSLISNPTPTALTPVVEENKGEW